MPNVLIIGATGKQGSGVVEGLQGKTGFNVFGTTRTIPNERLSKKGVTPVAFKYGDAASIETALKTSNAELVFFVTLVAKKATEIAHGKLIVDACKKAGVKFVVFSSVGDADSCPENVGHFKSKLEIEKYLKSSGLAHGILRPVAFYENFDDAATWNPLKKGAVKGLWSVDTKVKLVSCVDIGKAGAVMLQSPEEWNGKTIDCAACNLDGHEIAASLTEASGVQCKYATAMPRCIMACLMPDLNHMVSFFEDGGFTVSIDDFKKVVPEALTLQQWFAAKGQWANGEKFAGKKAA